MSGTQNKTQAELDAEAAAAAEAAKNNSNQNPGGGGNNSNNNEIKTLEEALKVIGDLRKENGSMRTKTKSQEDSFKALQSELGGIKKHLGIKDEVDPAKAAEQLKTANEQLEYELSMQQLAREHGIPVEHDEYFRFQIGKKLDALEDGKELGEDVISEVVGEVKKYSEFSKTKPNDNSSGVKNPKEKLPAGEKPNAMTAEGFVALPFHEQQKLYLENKPEYDRLRALANEKGLA